VARSSRLDFARPALLYFLVPLFLTAFTRASVRLSAAREVALARHRGSYDSDELEAEGQSMVCLRLFVVEVS
jgi:hypothetical protein